MSDLLLSLAILLPMAYVIAILEEKYENRKKK